MTTTLLAAATVLCWGVWIPTAQSIPGITQRTRTLYAAAGNLALAVMAFLAARTPFSVSWKAFWFPFLGGIVWTIGSLSAFGASQLVGLARAAGSWTPLNIVMSFVWGASLFGELSGLSAGRWASLAAGVALVGIGVSVIVRSQDRVPSAGASGRDVSQTVRRLSDGSYLRGILYAVAAGLLWGSYFVPAQWAKVPAEVGNLPLAFGISVAAGLAVLLPGDTPVRLPLRAAVVQLAAGILFGAGDLALLALVPRVGTGTGFTIAQLSLLVNATIGIWVFKVPAPGSPTARRVLIGILVAGVGGFIIALLR